MGTHIRMEKETNHEKDGTSIPEPTPHRHDRHDLAGYFAAKAMQTYLADKDLIDMFVYMNADVKEQVALAAYQMADAMLKARET